MRMTAAGCLSARILTNCRQMTVALSTPKAPDKHREPLRSRRLGTSMQLGDAMFDLFWELAFAYVRLNGTGQRLAGAHGESPGRISLMRSLSEGGPQSVVQLARSRGVMRQAVQPLANQLESDGLIAFLENPAHRRAKLMQLTPRGAAVLKRMLRSQRKLAATVAPGFDIKKVQAAIEVLRSLREQLARLDLVAGSD